MTNKLTLEEAKAIRTAWINSVIAEGYFAMNHYGMLFGFAYGEDVGRAFRQKIRQIQRAEKRKLSFEEVVMIYEDFERDLKMGK